MEGVFNYVDLSPDLVSKIGQLLEEHESVVALGHRNSGKVFLRDKIFKYLEEQKVDPVIVVKFQGAQPLTSSLEAFQRICDGIREAKEVVPEEMTPHELLAPVLHLGRKKNKKPILLASNVDAMFHSVARQFLQEVRAAVSTNALVVFLTGAYDLRELVFGPNSEFNVTNQYVLQGFGPEYFRELAQNYAHSLQLRFSSEEVYQELWKITGGNGYVLRVLLWLIVESRARGITPVEPISLEQIKSWSKRTPIMGADEAHLLRTAIRLVPLEPERWEQIRRLTLEGKAKVKIPLGPPGALTLSGVARRDGDKLTFTSPLFADLVRSYYDDLRLGDLYARSGKWDDAFGFYRKVDPSRRVRPANSDDLPEVDAVVRSLCAALHIAAGGDALEVCRLFEHGCRYVLGFPEIVFWRKKEESLSVALPEYSPGTLAREAAEKTFAQAGSSAMGLKPGFIDIAKDWDRAAFALVLESDHTDAVDAVLVGDFETRSMVSTQREAFFKELAQHFMRARNHATTVEGDRLRLKLRTKQAFIINDILSRLGQDVLDVRDILQRAAEALRTLGYRRIGFCLVDPKGEWAEGVWDASDDASVDLAQMTRWPVRGRVENIHQKVIRNGKYEIVEDAWKHELTNKRAVAAGKLKAFAVVPILDYKGLPIGSIVIERADKSPPSDEEAEDFVQFGRQLAALIEQGQRVNLMQSSLDKIPEPLLIVDPLRKIRYSNRKAYELLGTPIGWQTRHEGATMPTNFDGSIGEALAGHGAFRHFEGAGKDPQYKGALLCESIPDWKEDRAAGAVLHIEDLNYVFRLLRAFEEAAKAPQTSALLLSLLQAVQTFGHQWCRLYIFKGESEHRELVKFLGFGPKSSKIQEMFPIKIPPVYQALNRSEEFLFSLKVCGPVIFCRREQENCSYRDKFESVPIKVCAQKTTPLPEEDLGDFWLDFPLRVAEFEIGKITIQIDEKLAPQHYEFLKVLCEMASGLLQAFLSRDRNAERQADRIRSEIANLSLATFSHNIATRIAGLDTLISRYRQREADYPELKQLNDEMMEGYSSILAVVIDAKKKLQVVRPAFHEVAATAFFTKELKRLLGEALVLEAPMETWIRGDEAHLSSALNEIIENAKDAAGGRQLQVCASVSIVEHSGQEFVRWVIEDNGPGVEDELKDKIFEDFFTHHPGGEAGTGLGLSLVRRVFEAHGGKVRETGAYGKGARFEMEIPAVSGRE